MTLTEKQYTELMTAQDAAAADFWAYPNEAWQMNFQAEYLWTHFKVRSATFLGYTLGME